MSSIIGTVGVVPMAKNPLKRVSDSPRPNSQRPRPTTTWFTRKLIAKNENINPKTMDNPIAPTMPTHGFPVT